MKTTCVLLVLASMIAFAVCAKTFCNSASDCHCPSGEKAHCGIPLYSNIIHGDAHIGHSCHCEAPLSHCTGSCGSLTCGSHTFLGLHVQTHKICADGHCLCFLNKPSAG